MPRTKACTIAPQRQPGRPLRAAIFAIWMALQAPWIQFPLSSDAQPLLPTKGVIAPEMISTAERAGMPAGAYNITNAGLLSTGSVTPQDQSRDRARVTKISERLPLYFEANYGQADEKVKFVSRARGYTLSLTASEAVMTLQNQPRKKLSMNPQEVTAANVNRNRAELQAQDRKFQPEIRMKLLGATDEPKIVGAEDLPGKSNYLVGSDPNKWQKNIPHFAKVRYEYVYPGIDLVFYGNENLLEFDFIVAPGANPDIIRLTFEGADKIDIDQDGHLALQISSDSVRVKKPFIYQEWDGVRQQISGHFLLNPSITDNPKSPVVAFAFGSYDPKKPLVIDPGLEFSTFLGSNGIDDGNGIALDTEGNVYIVGSTGFGYADVDVFVTKFSADFTLLYASVFGGSVDGMIGAASDWGRGIAADAAGNAFVVGRIESSDFPTTDGTIPIGYADAFVAKLSSDGSTLLYSRRLGGSGQSDALAITLDSQGSAYITGWTTSPEFPTTPGAFDTLHRGFGYQETFVAKLSADGSQVLYSTFLGNPAASDPGGSAGIAIAVDAIGNAHVAGTTGWYLVSEFPATPGAFDTSWNGGGDAFVAKLNADGSQLLYATFLGGTAGDSGRGITLDTTGNAYVTGWTESIDFPTTPGAFQTTRNVNVGSADVFVVKLSSDGSKLLYSTFVGGSLSETPSGIAVDSTGNAYLSGTTCSRDFPTTAGAYIESQVSRCGLTGLEPNGDSFVAKLSADGSRLLYSTYFGGRAGDEGTGIAIDPVGNVYVTGRTNSNDFPTTPGSFEPGEGQWDAFVAKLSITDAPLNPGTIAFDAISYSVREDGGSAVITVIRRNGKDGEVSVDYTTSDSSIRPATAGLDYLPTSGTLVFGNGETSKSITVAILDDAQREDDERFLVTLSNVRGGATLGGNRTTVTITDQDTGFRPTLTVTKTGSGTGTVTDGSRRFRINCGLDCSESYGSGASVTLTASPASGSSFAGWSGGGCGGLGTCTLTLNSDTSVTANFVLLNPITPLGIVSPIVPAGKVP